MRYAEKMRETISLAVRKSIFDAASSLIREEGWPAFTTERIAERAGVSRGVLYNYFENKEDIAFSIVSFSIGTLTGKLREAAGSDASAADRIRAMVKISMDEFLSQRELHRALMENLPPSGQRAERAAELFREKDAVFAQVVSDGIRKGEFIDCDVSSAVMLLCGGVREACMRSILSGNAASAGKVAELFLRGVKK